MNYSIHISISIYIIFYLYLFFYFYIEHDVQLKCSSVPRLFIINKVILTYSYDVIFTGTLDDIVKKFKSMENAKVVFAAEQFCWPDSTLASQYPKTDAVNPYLNSGGFIGG